MAGTKPAENYRIHTVTHGDTLWGIAKKYLGDGNSYKQVTYRNKHFWNCTTFQTKGKSECAAKRIPEETLEVLTCEVLEEGSIDSDMVRSKITAIRAEKNNVVVFCLEDGSGIAKRWKDRSRAESWMPEMKEKARQRALQARRKKG